VELTGRYTTTNVMQIVSRSKYAEERAVDVKGIIYAFVLRNINLYAELTGRSTKINVKQNVSGSKYAKEGVVDAKG